MTDHSAITLTRVSFPGNWEALYVGDELVKEGHSVELRHVFDVAEGKYIESAQTEWCQIDLIEHFGGRAPESYEELAEVCDD